MEGTGERVVGREGGMGRAVEAEVEEEGVDDEGVGDG